MILRNVIATIAGLLCGLIAAPAAATDYPSRPVRLIVPFAAGGPSDFQARLIAQKLAEELKQPFIVENRPGAAGNIGVEAAAKAAPDGHTLLLCSTGPLVVNPAMFDKLPFNVQKDLAPVALLTLAPTVLAVNPDSPATSFAQLMQMIKEAPGKFSHASGGEGTTQHLAAELLKSMAGLQMTHVAYRGEGPATNDALAGHVPIIFMSIGTGTPYFRSGRLRPLAVTSAQRNPALPDVPSIAESGLTGYAITAWQGLLVPAGTPPEIVQKLNRSVNRILNDDAEVRNRLGSSGNTMGSGSPEDFERFLRSETTKWARLVTISGAKPAN